MGLDDWLASIAEAGSTLSLAFDDGEFVTMRDDENDRDLVVLFVDEASARAVATDQWEGAEVRSLDLSWLLAWLEGTASTVHVALSLPDGAADHFPAPDCAVAVRLALQEIGRLPRADVVEPPSSAPGDAADDGPGGGDSEYETFIRDVSRGGVVWGLWDETAWAAFNDEAVERVPFWSSAPLARACAQGVWSEATAKAVSAQEYLRYLGHLEQDAGVAALMLTPENEWTTVAARQVACELMHARALHVAAGD